MEITPIGYSPRPIDLAMKSPAAGPAAPQSKGFAEMMSTALSEVNASQYKAEELAGKLALGKDVELHEAVIASEEASLAFQYSLQIRNKLIEAYQEVMRMQV